MKLAIKLSLCIAAAAMPASAFAQDPHAGHAGHEQGNAAATATPPAAGQPGMNMAQHGTTMHGMMDHMGAGRHHSGCHCACEGRQGRGHARHRTRTGSPHRH